MRWVWFVVFNVLCKYVGYKYFIHSLLCLNSGFCCYICT
jgi:hypothetical protein